MRFETLKFERNKKKLLIGAILGIGVIATVLLSTSLAKFRNTESIPLVRGTINYTLTDLNIVAIYIGNGTDYEETDTVPTSGYNFSSTNSYCEKNGERLDDLIVGYDMSTNTLNVKVTEKNTKCYLYFDEFENPIEILASIDGTISSTFPTKAAGYTPNGITCTNDATAKFDYTNWAVEVDSKATSCTVNFETNKNQEFATYLKNKVCTTTPTTDEAAKDCLVNENGYRYEGTDPNNYVLFNDELWRIIGVLSVTNSAGTTQDLVKLIRNNNLDSLSWHGSDVNDWSTSTLQIALNTGYLNKEDITCNAYSTTVTKTCRFSKIGLNSIASNMIESIKWNLGGMSSSSSATNYYKTTVAKYYTYERATNVYSGRPTLWTGKIALMYPSDYGYSVLASSCVRTTTLDQYNTTACAGNSWLYKDGYQWTLVSISSNTNGILYVSDNGYVYDNIALNSFNFRPSIYLKSTTKIVGGLGTREIPYVIV